MSRTPYAVLADKLEKDVQILRAADAVLRRHQAARAKETFSGKLKTAAKLRGPKRATNGSGLVIPANLSFIQKRALGSYLIHQAVNAASGPLALDQLLDRLKTHKINYQAVASALRRGVIKKGPDFRPKHRTYLAGDLPRAFADVAVAG